MKNKILFLYLIVAAFYILASIITWPVWCLYRPTLQNQSLTGHMLGHMLFMLMSVAVFSAAHLFIYKVSRAIKRVAYLSLLKSMTDEMPLLGNILLNNMTNKWGPNPFMRLVWHRPEGLWEGFDACRRLWWDQNAPAEPSAIEELAGAPAPVQTANPAIPAAKPTFIVPGSDNVDAEYIAFLTKMDAAGTVKDLPWENDFVSSCSRRKSLTPKQREIAKKLVTQYAGCV